MNIALDIYKCLCYTSLVNVLLSRVYPGFRLPGGGIETGGNINEFTGREIGKEHGKTDD